MVLITWEKSYFRWRHEDTDLEYFVDGLEWETASSPLSYIGCGISVFNLLLAFKDCIGETT
jgi:hypothetical protein